MANSVDPDETARYEPSHLDLHCMHRYWFWSAVMKKFVFFPFEYPNNDLQSHRLLPNHRYTVDILTNGCDDFDYQSNKT